MILIRQFLLVAFLLSFCVVRAQQQPGSMEDSIAQSRVMELVEDEYALHYYDENINSAGDFIYSSQVETILKRKPGKDYNNYWVQLTDHKRYDSPGMHFNFFVDPKSWEVFYLDPETNLLWTWQHWKKQRKEHKSGQNMNVPVY